MTLTVAIDTATDVASVAVARDRAVVAEIAVPGRRHAAGLLPAVESAVALAGGTLHDVRRVLCADGPGSFTGLRIGFATAQGIVRGGRDVSVGTMPSLLCAAWTVASWCPDPVAVVYDALRGDVYVAVYRFHADGVEAVLGPCVRPLDTLAAEPAGLVVTEPGVVPAAAAVAWTGRQAVPLTGGPRAAALVALDRLPGGTREIADLVAFEPDYGRPAEAQARWERAHGRELPDSGGAFR